MGNKRKHRARMRLPYHWCAALVDEYRAAGYAAECGFAEGEVDGLRAGTLLVLGLDQAELENRVNDPLGGGRTAPRRVGSAEPLGVEERGDWWG